MNEIEFIHFLTSEPRPMHSLHVESSSSSSSSSLVAMAAMAIMVIASRTRLPFLFSSVSFSISLSHVASSTRSGSRSRSSNCNALSSPTSFHRLILRSCTSIPIVGTPGHIRLQSYMMYFRCAGSPPIQKFINICGLLCMILISCLTSSAADSLSTHPVILPHCSAPTLQESFIQETVQGFCESSAQECPSRHHHAASENPLSTRVAELNETTLEKALDLVHSSNGTYIAVLYYATWCPFSRQVRPVYDVLSTMFATVHHVAVEESSVRPSVLSQYGVHSFPILFMHNRTARVRYYGSRNLEYLIRFYQNYTGLSATEGEPQKREDCAFARLVYDAGTDAKEGCPYPWAISPEKWLQDDMYLNLAVVFLVLRLVYILVPAIVLRLKVHWEKGNFTVMPLRANYPLASNEEGSLLGNASQGGHEADVKQLGAGSANGLNNLSLPNWPPAHANSEVAESSSSRAGSSGEVQDMGEMY